MSARKHCLKVWPVYFSAMKSGKKLFTVRKNDRDFVCGDVVEFQEWDPHTYKFTGKKLYCRITYIMPGGEFGIDLDYCVLGIKEIS